MQFGIADVREAQIGRTAEEYEQRNEFPAAPNEGSS